VVGIGTAIGIPVRQDAIEQRQMARQDLLFELIKHQPRSQREGLWTRLSRYFRSVGRKAGRTAEAPAAAQPEPPAMGTVETGRQESSSRSSVPVNTFTIVLAVVILFVCFFCGYVWGRHNGWQQGWDKAVEGKSAQELADIQGQPAQPQVLDVPPPARRPARMETPAKIDRAGDKGQAEITGPKVSRQRGLNYLIIQAFRKPSSAQRARRFLASKGIETTVEREGQWHVLISTAGFDWDKQQREREAFIDQIRALGREYKKQPGSEGVDFRTCLYRKWR